MTERFSAFSFVDRITTLERGTRATGVFHVPAGLPRFFTCLAAEAVGQLAAWVAMAHVDFRHRPVAGLAGETLFRGEAVPGKRLDLEVEIETCDDSAVGYDGRARVDDATVVELRGCVGPMLPLEDFDAPEAVRRQFELLCAAGAPAGRFRGIARDELVAVRHDPPDTVGATLCVPASGAFFADHFPRRPVFPGTLLLDAQIRLAMALADQEATEHPCAPIRVTDVKIRSFVAPGQVLQLQAERRSRGNAAFSAALSARSNGKPIATASFELGMREES